MYLSFTHQAQNLPVQGLASLTGSTGLAIPKSNANSVFKALLREERPDNMLALLFILVLLLHVLGIMWRQYSDETEITPAKPMLMEDSMIAVSAAKPSIAPPPVAPPQTIKKPEPIKPQVVPIPKKMPPVAKKVLDTAPAEHSVSPEPVVQAANPTPSAASSAVSSSTESKTSTTNEAETFTEANFRANYASNPKPEYPLTAKSREWQGKVMLRVQVSAEGFSGSVKVEKSSGYEMLDDCAIEAVKKWKFIPAKRGETPVASSVIVPISFSLND